MLSVHTKREVRVWCHLAGGERERKTTTLSAAARFNLLSRAERPAEAKIQTKTLCFVIPTLVLTANGYAWYSLARTRWIYTHGVMMKSWNPRGSILSVGRSRSAARTLVLCVCYTDLVFSDGSSSSCAHYFLFYMYMARRIMRVCVYGRRPCPCALRPFIY